MTPILWDRILQVARWTPSPHNTQLLEAAIIGRYRSGSIILDRSRTLPDEDVTGNFIQCAMGMFLEALGIVAAANEGYKLIP